jgi:tRNA-dihydrouridine synthase B
MSTWPFSPATALAPMEGITHPGLRALYLERGGLGLVCTEFVRVSRAPLAIEAVRREVVRDPRAPLSVQVMGNEADKMAEAARIVCDAGADVVDVNMGCPMPRVVRKGVGAAMLRDPDLACRVVGAMRRATPGLLSVKIRAGYDDAAGVVAFGRRLEREGIDFLTVHPRRRCDFYEGVADFRIVKALTDALAIPVVGNGDIWTAADARRLRTETGCAAVMMGRPALRNPWIFEQLAALEAGRAPRAPSGDDVLAWLDRLRQLSEQTFGQRKHGPIGPLKELSRYLLRADPRRAEYEREALRSATVSDLFEILERELGGRAPETLDLDADGTLGLEAAASARASLDAA